MERVPEAEELMDGEAQAEAYARADFAEPNEWFCMQLQARAGSPITGRAVDLGCGPADIPIRLAMRNLELRVDAIDGSAEMLRWAERAVQAAGVAERVRLLHVELGERVLLPCAYGVVLSNSLLHHLRSPAVLWDEVARLLAPGGYVQVMDLMRPASPEAARAIVARYASGEADVLQRDFEASLCAAFRPDEVRAQVRAAGLGWLQVEEISDRHMLISGRAP